MAGRARYVGPQSDPRRYIILREQPEPGVPGELAFGAIRASDGLRVELTCLVQQSRSTVEAIEHLLDDHGQMSHRLVQTIYELFVGCAVTSELDVGSLAAEDFEVVWLVSEPHSRRLVDERASQPIEWRLGAIATTAEAVAQLGRGGSARPMGLTALLDSDLSPEDIFVRESGDLGLVVPRALLGQPSRRVGNLPSVWTPPEIEHGAPRSPSSEVWSVGALAFWLVVGQPPGRTADTGALMRAALVGVPRRRSVSRLIGQLLDADPSKRPTDLSAWASELRRTVSGERRPEHWLRVSVGAVAGAAAVATIFGLFALLRFRGESAGCFRHEPVVQWGELGAEIQKLVRKSGLCQRGGSMLGDMRVYDLFEPGERSERAAVVIDPPNDPPMLFPDGWYDAYASAGFGLVPTLVGYPISAIWHADGNYWEVPLTVSGSLISPSVEAPAFWVPTQVRYRWDELGGADGTLGLPMANPYSLGNELVLEFEHGSIRTSVFEIQPKPIPAADLVVDLIPPGEARKAKSELGDLRGKIVNQRMVVAWTFDARGRRRWVPTGDAWTCLHGETNSIPEEVPTYVLAQFPLGPAAECPLDDDATHHDMIKPFGGRPPRGETR